MNELHRALAARILRYLRTSGMAPGTHVPEHGLQPLCGTSRAPIRAALFHLADQGVLDRVPNKGFFVRQTKLTGRHLLQRDGDQSDETLYLRIADERLTRTLDGHVSENALMRRYGVSRSVLRRVLTRIAGEGWIERNEGHGWRFSVLIDSVQAYEESDQLRQAIEPLGLLAPGFRLQPDKLAALRRQQEMLRDGGLKVLDQMELFEINAAFHEGLAEMSGNRFLLATVRRMNQLRRLVETRRSLDLAQVRAQNTEHLEILDALDSGGLDEAASLLHRHLGRATQRKALAAAFMPGASHSRSVRASADRSRRSAGGGFKAATP